MAKLLEGKLVAGALKEKQLSAVAALAQKGITPTLGIIRIGERPDDISYEKGATKRCESVGVAVKSLVLPDDCTQESLTELIEKVNADDAIHGVLLFRPLPVGIDDQAVRNTLVPAKDVDGITDLSLAGVFTGKTTGFAPCTAQACLEILDYFGYKLEGKKVTIIGRSLVVGKPLSLMMTDRNATVTLCHTRTASLADACRQADILVAAAGRAGVVGSELIPPGQVVIDVGINFTPDGMCGDVDFGAVADTVGAITPVPGGVGTVTTSVLVGNVILAAAKAVGL